VAQQRTLPTQDQSPLITRATPGKHRHRAFFWEAGLLGAVLLLALLLRLWHLSTLTDNNYDEGVYWSSLRAMYAGNGLFTSVFSSQPPFFLLSLYPLVALLGPTLFAARLGVVVFSLIGILGIYLLARRLGGPWAGIIAAILLTGDYLYFIQSQTLDAEVPCIALMIVALAAATYADRYPWQAAGVSGAATALAMLEKLFAVAALAPLLILFFDVLLTYERALPFTKQPDLKASALARLRWPHRQTTIRAVVLLSAYLAGLALAGFLVLLPYLHQLPTLYQQVITFHLAAAQDTTSTLPHQIRVVLDANTEYPLAVLAAVGLIIGLICHRWHVFTAAAWTLGALIVLLHQVPLFPHHLVLLAPGLALSAALGLAAGREAWFTSADAGRMSASLRRIFPGLHAQKSKLLLPGLSALLLVGTLAFNLGDAIRYPLDRQALEMQAQSVNAAQISQVADDLQRLTTPQQQVIADDQFIVSAANRNVPPELVDTSQVRIMTGFLTTEQVIAIAERPQVGAILFYTGRFDMLPGLRTWVTQHFHLARSYGYGQNLFLRTAP
jgi:Dolichyl-phosphate-mannose-protein mannosyltransferase